MFELAKLSHGRIDVVINNAGILNENQWKRMIEVNFVSIRFFNYCLVICKMYFCYLFN